MTTYKSKSHFVEAVKWAGYNWDELIAICPDAKEDRGNAIRIPTEAGWVLVNSGEWIIRDAYGVLAMMDFRGFENAYEECLVPEPALPDNTNGSDRFAVEERRRERHKRGNTQLSELFVWCLNNLSKFPPGEGDWVEDVKRRLAEHWLTKEGK